MITTLGVVVPVADEEVLLPDCLRALRVSAAKLRHRVPAVSVRIVVVLDSCTDASEQVAERFTGVEIVRVDARRVGTARRAGCAHVIDTSGEIASLWLANTDSDSRVPADWLIGMHAYALSGADVVLGTVHPVGDIGSRLRSAWERAHTLHDGHHHVHGANLGIRADTYARLGGWPELVTGEDQALADTAADTGVNIVRTAQFPVVTSSRLCGRAPFGFSSYLRGLASDLGAESA